MALCQHSTKVMHIRSTAHMKKCPCIGREKITCYYKPISNHNARLRWSTFQMYNCTSIWASPKLSKISKVCLRSYMSGHPFSRRTGRSTTWPVFQMYGTYLPPKPKSWILDVKTPWNAISTIITMDKIAQKCMNISKIIFFWWHTPKIPFTLRVSQTYG